MAEKGKEKIKVTVIAPYEGLRETVSSVSGSYRDSLDINIVVGDLISGLTYAKDAMRDGADAIVSRGGTAEMIKNNVDIPVFTIQVSGYDYMRAIKLADNITGLKALVGFQYITERAHSVNELLRTDVDIFTVLNQDEIEPLLKILIERGYGLVIGDAATCRVAAEIGIRYLLLTSGEESVADAFESVISCVSAYNPRIRRLEMLEKLQQQDDRKAFILSSSGELIYGSADPEMLGITEAELKRFAENAGDELPHSFMMGRETDVLYISAGAIYDDKGEKYKTLFIDRIPIKEDVPRDGVEIRNFKIPLSREGFLRQNEIYTPETIRTAEAFCFSEQPILITGDEGVGKANLALTIHRHSKYWNRPYIQADCTVADPVGLLRDMAEDMDKLRDGAVFCLEGLETVPKEKQRELFNMIMKFGSSDFRFMATACSDLGKQAAAGAFDEGLYQYFAQLSLYVPNIRETKQNLSKVVNIFVIEANGRLGKQIVAVEDDAMKYIEELEWDYNYEELKQAIFQMVLIAEGNFLGLPEVMETMRSRRPEAKPREKLSLSGTLEEIELGIIKAVVSEENGNMSRAAKRLGVGRSTLWRKLKEAGLENM